MESNSLPLNPKVGSLGGWMSTENPTLFFSFRPTLSKIWINFTRKGCSRVEVSKLIKSKRQKLKKGNPNLSEDKNNSFLEILRPLDQLIPHSFTFLTLLTFNSQIIDLPDKNLP
jgi:hypothetical protein